MTSELSRFASRSNSSKFVLSSGTNSQVFHQRNRQNSFFLTSSFHTPSSSRSLVCRLVNIVFALFCFRYFSCWATKSPYCLKSGKRKATQVGRRLRTRGAIETMRLPVRCCLSRLKSRENSSSCHWRYIRYHVAVQPVPRRGPAGATSHCINV